LMPPRCHVTLRYALILLRHAADDADYCHVELPMLPLFRVATDDTPRGGRHCRCHIAIIFRYIRQIYYATIMLMSLITPFAEILRLRHISMPIILLDVFFHYAI